MKKKYNLERFEDAMECIALGGQEFSCNAICIPVNYNEEGWRCRVLHEAVFDIGSAFTTFNEKFNSLEGYWPTLEELKEIRLLSLAFSYEIARLKNNKKASL